MCFEKIKGHFSWILFNCVYLFLYSYCPPCVATLQHHLFLPWATVPLLSPFVMWKQPFSCSDSLSFHPDAWHSWQIGCGSEGDGLWKQCSCPLPLHTHSAHTREHGQTKIQKHHCARVYVRVSHTILIVTQPSLETKNKGCVANRVMTHLNVYQTKKKQEMEMLTSFHCNLEFRSVFTWAPFV